MALNEHLSYQNQGNIFTQLKRLMDQKTRLRAHISDPSSCMDWIVYYLKG